MPKKSLGQNFLINTKVAYDMVETSNISTKDTVLEIGPGKGVLTKPLLEKAGKVISVEKDDDLIPLLHQKFSAEIESGKLILVNDDILNFLPSDYKLTPNNYKLIANIPYYITGEIIRKFLESDMRPSEIALLVQKEVAERIVSKNGKESILSISVKTYGKPKYERTVKAGNFFPKPKVDSAILSIKNISKDFFKDIDEKEFFKVVKSGFAHKRKVLIGNLKDFTPREKLEEIFKNLKISSNERAENLNISAWQKLTKLLTEKTLRKQKSIK